MKFSLFLTLLNAPTYYNLYVSVQFVRRVRTTNKTVPDPTNS